MNRCKKKNLLLGACLGVLIGIVAFAPIYMRHGGRYMEYGDYYLQYVPFIKELKRMLSSNSFAWSWNSFLGDSFVGAYSYYTVFNPFAWITAAFPNEYLLYGTLFVTMLKLAICMVGAMLYIRRFCKSDIYALIGALLYTFSGFTLVNTSFFFFLDVIALFPFLLYALERLIEENKRACYVMALTLNAATNYYFFISTVFLVILYVGFRLRLYRISSWKEHSCVFWRVLLYSVIGTGLAGFALLPSFYAILGSGKAAASIGTKFVLMYWPQNILERLRTLVAPIESGRYHAFFDCSTWSSTGIYLPLFGCTLAIQWSLQKRDWMKKMCIFLVICYFVPFLNAAFNLFSSTEYTRWLYGLAMMLSLVTVLTLEEIEDAKQVFQKRIVFGVTGFAFILLMIPAGIYFLYHYGISIVNRFASACTTEFFMGYTALAVMLVLSALNYAGLWYIVYKKKYSSKTVVVILVAVCTLNFSVYNMINYDNNSSGYSNQYYFEKTITEGTEDEGLCFEYRIDHPGQIANYSLFKNKPAVNYYNSLQNPGSSRFAEAVGICTEPGDTILLTPDVGCEFVDALLSVKYYYDYDGNDSIPVGFAYLNTDNGVDIYENENYISMGFVYDGYCLEEQLTDLSAEERARAMLQALVIDQTDEDVVSKYLMFMSDIHDEKGLSDMVADRRKTVCSFFAGTSDGFEAKIQLDKDNIVFFSIPNDPGWEVTVNGKPADVVEVHYGLMGVCCESGENTIRAEYHTQGWVLGCLCSMSCVALWMLIEWNIKRRIRKGDELQ